VDTKRVRRIERRRKRGRRCEKALSNFLSIPVLLAKRGFLFGYPDEQPVDQ
jgi:hypothetical protein